MKNFEGGAMDRFLKDESSGGSPEARRKALRAAALGAGVIAGASAVVPTIAEAGSPQIEVQKQILNEADIDYLAQNVYHEARGESLKGQLAVAQITLARLLSGKFGRTLADVVFAQNQFSWTKDPRILMARMDDNAFENLKTTITFLAGGQSFEKAVKKMTHETGLPSNTYYYKRTDWDEHNSEEKRMSERTKTMFKKLKNVGVIDSHTFYTD